MIGSVCYGQDFIRELGRIRVRLRTAAAMFTGRVRVRSIDLFLRADNSLHLALVSLVEEIRSHGDSATMPGDKPLTRTGEESVNFAKVLPIIAEARDDLETMVQYAASRRGRSEAHIKRAAKAVASLYEALVSESLLPPKGASRK